MNELKKLEFELNAAIKNPKTVYRTLIKEWHPDVNPPEKKEQANKIISELSQLFNALPVEITRASNWYQKFKYARKY